jgi:hypothetical protein
MKLRHAAAIVTCVALAGCASNISKPEAVQALSSDQLSAVHISDVSADAASGVEMGDTDFDAICRMVHADIQKNSPGVLADASTAGAYKMQIHFTKFDRGSAFARAMLIGLGQIRIEATVNLVDTTGKSVAQYNVSKDFAIGGLAGATTDVSDVEEGFAKSVAYIVNTKA